MGKSWNFFSGDSYPLYIDLLLEIFLVDSFGRSVLGRSFLFSELCFSGVKHAGIAMLCLLGSVEHFYA